MNKAIFAAAGLLLLAVPASAESIKNGHPLEPFFSRSTATQFGVEPRAFRNPAPRAHALAPAGLRSRYSATSNALSGGDVNRPREGNGGQGR